ncbi:MAG: hypothetical protein JNM21_04705 [Taibaiella sp.]|nr:hypothetical protein [Taibaiella sp.]
MILKQLLLTVLLLSGVAYAQQINVAYYNFAGIEVTKDQACYFSEFHITDTGVLHNRFFMASNKIALVEHFKDTAALIKEGKSLSFYINEQLKSIGQYKENKRDGLWLSFYPNGYLKDSVWYNMVEPVGIALSWHKNGMIADSVHYGADKSFKITWFDNGQPGSYGYFREKEDSLTGKWINFHRNGAKASELEYDNQGQLIKAVYYDENGQVAEAEAWDSYVKQVNLFYTDFGKYLNDSFYFKPDFGNRSYLEYVAIVDIALDENGKISDVFFALDLDEGFKKVLLDKIYAFKHWKSFKDKNRNVAGVFPFNGTFYGHKSEGQVGLGDRLMKAPQKFRSEPRLYKRNDRLYQGLPKQDKW